MPKALWCQAFQATSRAAAAPPGVVPNGPCAYRIRRSAYSTSTNTPCLRRRWPIVTESDIRDIRAEEEYPTIGISELRISEGALKLEAVPYNNFAGLFGLHQALQNIRSVGTVTHAATLPIGRNSPRHSSVTRALRGLPVTSEVQSCRNVSGPPVPALRESAANCNMRRG